MSRSNLSDLRVLHVLDHSLPLHSGYTFRTAAILREQARRGWSTFHLTGPKHHKPTGIEEQHAGLHFYRTLEPPSAWGRWAVLAELDLMKRLERRLLEVARQVQPHIIHAHSPVLNALPALRVGRALGIPVVYEIRAFWEDAAVDHGTTTEGSMRYRTTRAMETHALKQVAHAFTICQGLRQDIIARGIPSDRLTVIPNAVDLSEFEPGGQADPELLQALGLGGCTVVGFIGSFYAYEGLDLLIEALPLLRQACPDVRLLLVGGGPQDAALKAQAQRLGVAEQVVFTGRVPHTEVGRYYDLIDVLAYPRHRMRLTDLVTPLKPLEAMAQGRVMVASDVGGHRELIEDGVTGRLFAAGSAPALAQALRELLDNRQPWPVLRSNGRRFVETQRNWAASVARYEEPYTNVVASVAA